MLLNSHDHNESRFKWLGLSNLKVWSLITHPVSKKSTRIVHILIPLATFYSLPSATPVDMTVKIFKYQTYSVHFQPNKIHRQLLILVRIKNHVT